MTNQSTDDVFVDPLSRREIEERALAWREALRVSGCWQPNMLQILETSLPLLWPDFALVSRPDEEMTDLEAYTQFQPPQIVFPDSGYAYLRQAKPRARWTAAHELGHLVLHEAISKPRSTAAQRSRIIDKAYNSAEWQANTFAEYFLMPEHIISEFSSAHDVAFNCNVSLQAAEIRLRGILSEKKEVLPEIVRHFLNR